MKPFEIDFIGIGAAKSGSSWISSILNQHVDIQFSSRKEVAYFNARDFLGADNPSHQYPPAYYYNFWRKTRIPKLRGEFSPQYLYDGAAAKKIAHTFPGVKLIAVLRNPVNRVLSHFQYDRLFNALIPENMPFEQAVVHYGYLLEAGLYAKQLKRYFDLFPEKNIHIIIFEKALEDEKKAARALFRFLGLKTPENIDFTPINRGKKIKFAWVNGCLKTPGKVDKAIEKRFSSWGRFKQSRIHADLVNIKNRLISINTQRIIPTPVPEKTRRWLSQYYAPSIHELERLIHEPLNVWKETAEH